MRPEREIVLVPRHGGSRISQCKLYEFMVTMNEDGLFELLPRGPLLRWAIVAGVNRAEAAL